MFITVLTLDDEVSLIISILRPSLTVSQVRLLRKGGFTWTKVLFIMVGTPMITIVFTSQPRIEQILAVSMQTLPIRSEALPCAHMQYDQLDVRLASTSMSRPSR